ncbi:MAG: hypothetical protein IJ785_03640 [Bacteroidales bacterium]|nr:hypothetical protein [Bacteroidales bacterium]
MRKILSKTSIVLFAAAMFMVGCKNETEQIFQLQMPEYSGEDKTTFGSGNTTLWTAGDPVLINSTSGNVQSSSSISFSTPIDPINKMFYSLYAGRATSPSFDANTCSYTYTMPSSFTYTANQLQAPMVGQCAYIGKDARHTIIYSNICTLLKLEFVVIPDQVTITSENTALSGNFTATYADGNWTVTAPAATSSNKTLTITNSNYNSVMYVPLPAGNHKLTISGTCNVSGTNVAAPFYKEMTSSVNMLKGYLYTVKCAHAFSISANRKVFFSPGNLQYYNTSTYPLSITDLDARWDGDGINSNSCFRFAQHQWDNNITSNNIKEERVLLVTYHDVRGNGAWIDLFGWATGRNPGRSRTTSLAYSGSGVDYADWGNNLTLPIINAKTNESWRTWHTEGSWYTLGRSEWTYLIGHSTKKLATVNGTAGLIIAPDDFSGSLQTSYSGTAWTNLEKRGVIFLPGSGYRHYGEGIRRSWGYSSDWNGYWTMTDSEEWGDYYAYFMKFSPSYGPNVERPSVSHSGTANSNKPTGLCVRLVQNAN